MKYIKLILSASLLQFIFTGCSYVSDMVEGAITDRASFSIQAQQVGSNVVITWSKTDLSTDFAGIEIYRTRKANDEYSGYITIADRDDDASLASGVTVSYTHLNANSTKGVYFYRVGIIHWDESQDKRTNENGYFPEYPDAGWDGTTNYNNHTDIDAISGSARVEIN